MTSHSLRFWITLRRPGSHAASERERNKKKTIIFSTNKKKNNASQSYFGEDEELEGI